MAAYCVTCEQDCPGCDCVRCDQCADLDPRWAPASLDDVEVLPATKTVTVDVKGGAL